LVTGATGTVGKLVVNGLLSRNAQVRVMSRSIEKGREILGDKVEIVKGDINEPLDDSVFRGVNRLFLLTQSSASQAAVEGRIAAQAKKVGVTQIVKLSVFGATSSDPLNSLMRWHLDAENEVAKAEIPSTVFLRPNLFLQNFSRDDVASIKHTAKFYRAATPETKISHVDVRDIADVAVTVLTSPIEAHAGMTYYITGPESLTYDEVAHRISEVLGRKVDVVYVDDQTFYNSLKAKMPNSIIHMLLKLFQFYKTNQAAVVCGDTHIVTGKPARSVKEYFADHKKDYD